MSDNVTLLIKGCTLVPANKSALPDLRMRCQRDEEDVLSSDNLSEAFEQPGEGLSFPKAITLDKLPRGSQANVTFSYYFKGETKSPALGKAVVKIADLIKHAEFVARIKEQNLVLKHPSQPCPMRIDVVTTDVASALEAAQMALEVDILAGSKIEAAKVLDAGDQVYANIFVSAKKILATRGSKTDTFCRVMLVLDSGVEHEVGRTEVVMDNLSPEYNAYISLSYSKSAATAPDSKTLLRFEICDPGTASNEAKGSPTKQRRPSDDFAVIGAGQSTLAEIHSGIEAGTGSGTAGLFRNAYQLRQKGELQGLIEKKEKEKENKYGVVFAVIEKVAMSDACVSLIIGASKLYTNKLSMRPDPYVRMYRLFDVVASDYDPKDEDRVPDRCPVYTSNYVKSTREASWSTTPIPMSLLTNDNPNARIVIEVWDEQFQAEDRLIGSTCVTAAQLLTSEHGDGPKDPSKQTYVTGFPLEPPSLFAQTNSAVDRTASFLTGGVASKPGNFAVYQVKKFESPDLAAKHHDCFDVDTVLREKKASQPLSWEPLSMRRAKMGAKLRSGIVVMDSTCGSRMLKYKRAWGVWLGSIGVSKVIKRFAPFYRMRVFIGAKFGTAFEAYFAFYYTLIRLNLLVALVWLVFLVFPQIVLEKLSVFQVLIDLARAFDAEKYIELAQSLSNEAGSGPAAALIPEDDEGVFTPGVLLFSGYYPKASMEGTTFGSTVGSVGDDNQYQIDFFYVACLILTLAISLMTVVCSLGGQIGAVRETGSSGRGDGTGQVMDALFGGWDHLSTTSSSTSQTRYALVTQMKEGMGEAVRAAERAARFKTAKERRNIMIKRVVASCLIVLFTLTSVVTVFFATSPPGVPVKDGPRDQLDKLGAQLGGVPVHTLLVTLINVSCPIFIKTLVKLQSWESPETEIRYTLSFQIVLKLANLVVLYFAQKIGTVSTLLPPPGPDELDERCPEEGAAKNFVLLIVTDMFVSGVAIYFIKGWILYHPARIWKERIKGKKAETAEDDLKAVCGPFGKKGLVDLPTEIVNICYRQTIMLVGASVSPWIFLVGVFTSAVLYFFKYLVISGLSRPPIKPFKASNIKKLFYAVLLFSNLVGIFPVAHFLSSPANPNCGPLRTFECALVASPHDAARHDFVIDYANTSACTAMTLDGRPNYLIFSETLLPVNIMDIELRLDTVMNATSSGDFGALASLGTEECDSFIVFCWISLVLTALFAPITLMMISLLLCICLFFVRKQARRLNRELDAAQEEAANEHHDKVKLLRYAGVSLD